MNFKCSCMLNKTMIETFSILKATTPYHWISRKIRENEIKSWWRLQDDMFEAFAVNNCLLRDAIFYLYIYHYTLLYRLDETGSIDRSDIQLLLKHLEMKWNRAKLQDRFSQRMRWLYFSHKYVIKRRAQEITDKISLNSAPNYADVAKINTPPYFLTSVS